MEAVKITPIHYTALQTKFPLTLSNSWKDGVSLLKISSFSLQNFYTPKHYRLVFIPKSKQATITPQGRNDSKPRIIRKLNDNLSKLPESEKQEDIKSVAVASKQEDFKTALQCEHFERCSGCTHEWRLDKPHILKEAREFFDDCGVHDFSFNSGRLWGWRCRAKLAVRGTSETPQIGLYQEGTHNVLDIPSCRAHHPQINSAVELLKEAIKKLKVRPYDEDAGIGDLRYVQMAVTTYDTSLPVAERYRNGKVQVALVWNSRNESSFNADKLTSLYEFLWTRAGPKSAKHIIHSIWANFQTSSSNIIFGGRWRHLVGELPFWERLGGVDICLAPASFGQANTQAFNMMLYQLCKHVQYGSAVVELYAGVGIIGLCLAANRKCRSVKCVEVNKESKLPFEQSLARLPKSVDCKITWHCADVSKVPIQWLEGADVVVIDPPRRGIDPSVIDALAIASLRGQGLMATPSRVEKRPWVIRAQQPSETEGKATSDEFGSWPHTLIYISCGWTSFKQDCQSLLSNKAWHLESAQAFNFFPGTDSIEVLAIFKCGQRIKPKKKKSPERIKLKKKKSPGKTHAKRKAT